MSSSGDNETSEGAQTGTRRTASRWSDARPPVNDGLVTVGAVIAVLFAAVALDSQYR